MAHRVTGNGLVTLVTDFSTDNVPFYSRPRMVAAAGYYSYKIDGSIRFNFVDFYEALIQAKKDLGIWAEPTPESDDEPEWTDLDRAVMKEFPEVDEDDVTNFSDALSTDFGITANSLTKSFVGKYSSEEEIAQSMFYADGEEVPYLLKCHIDWQGVWDDELSHDYNIHEYNKTLYVFSA